MRPPPIRCRSAPSDQGRTLSKGRGTKDEGRGTRDEGRGTRDEGSVRFSENSLVKLWSVLGACVLLVASQAAAQTRRPNVLLILADDQRADTIAAHGNPHIRTPTSTAGGKRLQLPGQLRLRRQQRGGLRAEPRHADERPDVVPRRYPTLAGATAAARSCSGGMATSRSARASGTTDRRRGCGRFQRGRTVMFGGMSDHTKVPVQRSRRRRAR